MSQNAKSRPPKGDNIMVVTPSSDFVHMVKSWPLISPMCLVAFITCRFVPYSIVSCNIMHKLKSICTFLSNHPRVFRIIYAFQDATSEAKVKLLQLSRALTDFILLQLR